MKIAFLLGFFLQALYVPTFGQVKPDSAVVVGEKIITLSEVVVDNRLDVSAFIEKVKSDTSFYKAFRNLRVLGFTALNDIRMLNRKGELKASLKSRTLQKREHGCRSMVTLEEEATGDIYNDQREFNYYTAQMYASLFFTKDTICGETNIVKGIDFSTSGKSGIEKHKEQLKTLFFNPGRRISGLPFMSNKTAIYDDEMADSYDMSINMDVLYNTSCYVFTQKVKPGKSDKVIVDEMTTWFNDSTWDVVARKYSLSYRAGVYDFAVDMEVQMTQFGQLTVPSLIRYSGNWKAIFKDRERGVFTATLFDFKAE